MVSEDDRETRTLELTLEGGLQNRVRYADGKERTIGCGIGVGFGEPGQPRSEKAPQQAGNRGGKGVRKGGRLWKRKNC